MKAVSLLVALVIACPLFSQEINGFAKVTAIAGTVLTVSNVDEFADSFEDGEQVIVMQMQDNVIGANTGDNANFGLLSSIGSAGLYEIRIIQSHTESSGTPSTITLDSPLSNSYSTGTNSSLQIITFPEFGSPNFTSGNLSPIGWNGNTGGVLALQVPGILTIGGDIDADFDGFLGASPNNGASTGCAGGSNYRIVSSPNFAQKGEGIYKATNANFDSGRARILSGAGGGNSHNAGGGGGGNFTAGGLGGPGWPTCSPSAGGMGGISLSGQISVSRFFMGGGGGSGEGNNSGVQPAGNGGGIIIITADEINTTGTCGTGHTISAIGGSVLSDGGVGDGNSGGGAGGTILIDVNTWSIAAGCPLTLQANGGDGGDVANAATHGGGGGGGQGTIIYSIAQPTSNTTTNTLNGSGGVNCTTCSTAGGGGGSNNQGIIDMVTGPLPIELISFNANVKYNNFVDIEWKTETEIDNDFFSVEKSSNGLDWVALTKLSGAGNSVLPIKYETQDKEPFSGISYYRLKQVDFDGQFTYTSAVSVNINQRETFEISIYPNPTKDQVTIESITLKLNDIQIYNALSQNVKHQVKIIDQTDYKVVLDLSHLKSGVYYINIDSKVNKVIKQ